MKETERKIIKIQKNSLILQNHYAACVNISFSVR